MKRLVSVVLVMIFVMMITGNVEARKSLRRGVKRNVYSVDTSQITQWKWVVDGQSKKYWTFTADGMATECDGDRCVPYKWKKSEVSGKVGKNIYIIRTAMDMTTGSMFEVQYLNKKKLVLLEVFGFDSSGNKLSASREVLKFKAKPITTD